MNVTNEHVYERKGENYIPLGINVEGIMSIIIFIIFFDQCFFFFFHLKTKLECSNIYNAKYILSHTWCKCYVILLDPPSSSGQSMHWDLPLMFYPTTLTNWAPSLRQDPVSPRETSHPWCEGVLKKKWHNSDWFEPRMQKMFIYRNVSNNGQTARV